LGGLLPCGSSDLKHVVTSREERDGGGGINVHYYSSWAIGQGQATAREDGKCKGAYGMFSEQIRIL